MAILKDETVKNAHRYFLNTTDFFRSCSSPLAAPIKQNSPNLGDIPNDPTQQKNWVCNRGEQRIAVAPKKRKVGKN
jgi:hypothetical protein